MRTWHPARPAIGSAPPGELPAGALCCWPRSRDDAWQGAPPGGDGVDVRLASKLLMGVIALLVALLAVDGGIAYRRERHLLDLDLQHDLRVLGLSLRGPLSAIWRNLGREVALNLLEDANRTEPGVQIRWVWLDADSKDASAPVFPDVRARLRDAHKPLALQWRASTGEDLFVTYVPVPGVEGRPGAIELRANSSRRDAYLAVFVWHTVILTLTLILSSSLLAALLGLRFVARPLQQLTEKARRVSRGEFSGPVQLAGRDELSVLARAMNQMADSLAEARRRLHDETDARIAAVQQLRHSDRLRTVGMLASGVAHELGTPLNIVSGRAALIEEAPGNTEEVLANAATIRRQAARMATIIRQLLQFSRRDASLHERLDLAQTARSATRLITPLFPHVSIHLEGADAPAPVLGNEGQLEQVLLNLLTNAAQSMDGRGRIALSLGRTDASPPAGYQAHGAGFCFVCVEDEGAGIPPDHIEHIFDPFFTTKNVGDGTGLGLSICHGIVQEHGGWIEVQSQVGKGSCFTIYLPRECEP